MATRHLLLRVSNIFQLCTTHKEQYSLWKTFFF